jgi:hypothetical protein
VDRGERTANQKNFQIPTSMEFHSQQHPLAAVKKYLVLVRKVDGLLPTGYVRPPVLPVLPLPPGELLMSTEEVPPCPDRVTYVSAPPVIVGIPARTAGGALRSYPTTTTVEYRTVPVLTVSSNYQTGGSTPPAY